MLSIKSPQNYCEQEQSDRTIFKVFVFVVSFLLYMKLNSVFQLVFLSLMMKLFTLDSFSGQVPCTEHQAVDFGPLWKTAQRYLRFCILLFCWIVVMTSECSPGGISPVLYFCSPFV